MIDLLRNKETGDLIIASGFKSMFPSTCFPPAITEDIYEAFGFDVVYKGEPPTFTSPYQTHVQQGAEEIDGTWYTKTILGPVFEKYLDSDGETVTVEAQLAEHKLNIDDRAAEELRGQRNVKLANSDWTQLTDSPSVDQEEWSEYRQQLRDVPNQEGFPFEGSWPVDPNGSFDGLFAPAI
jgi:hypothetical protein